MDSTADLRALVRDLKNAACDGQIHILQTLGGRLINDYRLEALGVTIEPLWVEAYYYDEARFPTATPTGAASRKTGSVSWIFMSAATAAWTSACRIRRTSACPSC